jgi:DNA-directed RNA polymerase subunit RPC12/RpoP
MLKLRQEEELMRIQVRLPQVNPEVYQEVKACPHCGGEHFKSHGQKGHPKKVRDVHHQEVSSQRLKCMRCKRTFRIYPQGVSQADQSDHLKGMSVLLYILGLSYGGNTVALRRKDGKYGILKVSTQEAKRATLWDIEYAKLKRRANFVHR